MKGPTFESWLDEEGIKEEVYAKATTRVLAYRIEQLMKEQRIGKTAMAARMRTSRPQLDRLLDPDNDRVQLNTIKRAAAILGRKVRIELVDAEAPDAA